MAALSQDPLRAWCESGVSITPPASALAPGMLTRGLKMRVSRPTPQSSQVRIMARRGFLEEKEFQNTSPAGFAPKNASNQGSHSR